MKEIYDNGNRMLGQTSEIRKYNDKMFREDMIVEEQWLELAKELVFFNDTDILAIDYDNGMGILIEKWEERDILRNMEED